MIGLMMKSPPLNKIHNGDGLDTTFARIPIQYLAVPTVVL